MEKLLIVHNIALALLTILIGVIVALSHEMIKEIRTLRKLLKHDIQSQSEWLFNQLYSIAPGKVLRPDEVEEDSASKPAKVINPNKDPMNEFSGKKTDYFV